MGRNIKKILIILKGMERSFDLSASLYRQNRKTIDVASDIKYLAKKTDKPIVGRASERVRNKFIEVTA